MRLGKEALVKKAVNNNIVLVDIEGVEKILFAKGIGFKKKEGVKVKIDTEIEKVFIMEDPKNICNFKKIVENVDNKLVFLCESFIDKISNTLNEKLSENVYIGLIDHVAFAIKRLKNKELIENPFISEIEVLYREDFELAKELGRKIKKEFNIDFPRGEVGFIALHIHSARNNGELSNTMKYSFLGNKVIKILEEELGIEIDKKSLEYTRFLTHIRFAIERVIKNLEIENGLKETIKRKYRESYKLAKYIVSEVELSLEKKISDDEIAYLTMHIERLKNSFKK